MNYKRFNYRSPRREAAVGFLQSLGKSVEFFEYDLITLEKFVDDILEGRECLL